MVGAARFELATSCTPSKRASQATLRPEPLPLNGERSYYSARRRIQSKDLQRKLMLCFFANERVRRVTIKYFRGFH